MLLSNLTINESFSVHADKMASLFKVVPSPEQLKHARVWRMLFHCDDWLNKAVCMGLNPVLIGYDLRYCYHSSDTIKKEEKYLVLRPGDEAGAFTKHSQELPSLFFACLRPHNFDENAKVIHFKMSLASMSGRSSTTQWLRRYQIYRRYSFGTGPSQIISFGGITNIDLDR